MARKRKRVIGGYRFARFAGQPQPELVEAGADALRVCRVAEVLHFALRDLALVEVE